MIQRLIRQFMGGGSSAKGGRGRRGGGRGGARGGSGARVGSMVERFLRGRR